MEIFLSSYNYNPVVIPSPYAPSASTIYSAFANKAFYPQTYVSIPISIGAPADPLTAVVNNIKYSSPSLRSMIIVAPSTSRGWSPVPNYNAILIGLLLPEVQKYRNASNWTSAAVVALKARLAAGGKAGVLTLDSYSLNFNYVTWIQ